MKFKIDTKHPTYEYLRPTWQKCLAFATSPRAVRDLNEAALPMLTSQREEQGVGGKAYRSYQDRAIVLGLTRRTITGHVGAITRREPALSDESALSKEEPITRDRRPWPSLAKEAIRKTMVTDKFIAYVDAEGEGAPYVVRVDPESMINWSIGHDDDGREVLQWAVIEERARDESQQDPFLHDTVQRWRHLSIDEETGRYVVRVYQRRKDTQTEDEFEQVGEDVFPQKTGGQYWDRIPAVCITSTGPKWTTAEPIINDIVEINAGHYRNSADYEHGLHLTAIPTPWAAGWPTTDQTGKKLVKLRIGSDRAWVSSDPNAKAGMLEFTGAGLGQLASAMDSKKKEAAVMGARLLEEQPRTQEAFATVRLRNEGQKSALQELADSVAEGLGQLLSLLLEWRGAAREVTVDLKVDFDVSKLSSQDLTALVGAMIGGGISFESYYRILEEHEMYPEGWTIEDEIAALSKGLPGALDSRVDDDLDDDSSGNDDNDEPEQNDE